MQNEGSLRSELYNRVRVEPARNFAFNILHFTFIKISAPS